MGDSPRQRGQRKDRSRASRPEPAPSGRDHRLRSDDQIEEWQNKYGGRLLAICSSKGLQYAAEDILQEVWIKAWRHLDREGTVNNAWAWLSVCTRNACTDCLRALRNQAKQLERPDRIEDHRAPFESVDDKELRQRRQEAIATLSNESRQVIEMYLGG